MLNIGLGLLLAALPAAILGRLADDSAQFRFTVCVVALGLAGGVGLLAYLSPFVKWWHWFLIALSANLFLGALASVTNYPILYAAFTVLVATGALAAIGGAITAITHRGKQPTTASPTGKMMAPIVGRTADGQLVYGSPISSQSTNVLAILALVFGFLGGVLAIVFGHIALSQIRRTGESGRGLAITGLVLGYVFLGFWLVVIALVFANA
ncbi:DUF4190 domain-containing protein [Rhodococcus triatomae]